VTETEDLERARDAVRAAVLADVSRTRGTRRRRAVAIVTGTALLLTAGAAVGAKELARPDQGLIDTTVICYQEADLGSAQQYMTGYGAANQTMPVDVGCEQVWIDDMWKYPSGPPEGHHPFPVPRIAACLDPQGIGAGFPLWDDSETPQQLCERLGLPYWDGSLQIGTGRS